MKTFRWLRIVIVSFWTLLVLGIVLDIALESHLPETLQRWNRSQIDLEPTVLELVIYVVGMIALVGNVMGSIALFFRRRWGARTFLVSSVVMALCMLGTDPSVTHPVAETIYEADLVLEGLIIGLAFFSSALDPDDGLPDDVEKTFT